MLGLHLVYSLSPVQVQLPTNEYSEMPRLAQVLQSLPAMSTLETWMEFWGFGFSLALSLALSFFPQHLSEAADGRSLPISPFQMKQKLEMYSPVFLDVAHNIHYALTSKIQRETNHSTVWNFNTWS